MRIISEGPDWSHEFSCAACQSQLEAETNDLQVAFDEGVPWYFVVCPVCTNQYRVDESTISAKITHRLLQERKKNK